MRFAAPIAVVVLALIPLATLVHRDDRGRWDVQRSAMAAPDEFSYLLMADNFLQGRGLDLRKSIGRDTFYPPGYPLLLAGWSRITGGDLTTFKAHAFNALLLSADTVLVYLLTRLLLSRLAWPAARIDHRPSTIDHLLPLLITALFAANWHVLETSLLIMSEPAFMLVTLAWLMLILEWPDWHRSVPRTLLIAGLASAAWSIRGAGVVTIAASLLAPPAALWRQRRAPDARRRARQACAALAAVLLLAGAYQVMLMSLAPEKSVASAGQSDNSYSRQLLFGLTDNGSLHLLRPGDWPALLRILRDQVLSHCDDFAASFVPWPREDPDALLRNLIGKIMAILALLGWAHQALFQTPNPRPQTANIPPRIGNPTAQLPMAHDPLHPLANLHLFLVLYLALYLIWPFHYARFWSPILPVMLVFAADAIVRFGNPRRLRRALLPLTLLALLFVLTAEEDVLQLDGYARRLNYVSDCIAATVDFIIRQAPNPRETIIAVGDEDRFMMSWYLRHTGYTPRSPDPHLPPDPAAPDKSRHESVEQMLVGSLAELQADPHKRVFLVSYFGDTDVWGIIANIQRTDPDIMARFSIEKSFQKEIITTVWEFHPRIITPATGVQDATRPFR